MEVTQCREYVDCREYIAVVSRQLPSRVALEEAKVHAITECSQDSANISVGSFLVVESGARTYLARVAEIVTQDIYAISKTPVISLEQELAVDLSPLPRLITLELIIECVDDRCSAPMTPVNIHSRVRLPRSGEVSKMLGLPEKGIEIGSLSLPTGEELQSERVRLTEQALRHHILVVGTTGSGKTVFLKNLIYEILRNRVGRAVVLDVVGHYHHIISNDVKRIAVILPITLGTLSLIMRRVELGGEENSSELVKGFVKEVSRNIAETYFRDVFRGFGLRYRVRKIRVLYRLDKKRRRVTVRRIVADARVENLDIEVVLYPWALTTSNVIMILPRLSAVFTAQARMFYRKILLEIVREYVRTCKGEHSTAENLDYDNLVRVVRKHGITLRELYDFMFHSLDQPGRRNVMVYQYIADKIGVHKGTLENIIRGFLSLIETDLFDVSLGVSIEGYGDLTVEITEPNYDEVFRNDYVIVDLRETTIAQERLVVYRVLDRLYRFVESEWIRRGGKRESVIIAIDEAHLFFPQTREESEKELVESYLTRLARLGRARGIGLVFATHSPDDLNDLVLQLTNTKVVLRSEEKMLEKLGVPSKERRILLLAPPGLAYVRTFIYRMPILVKLDPAKTIHVG
ncbi:MAG: ATP-binding protein [Crenarchaeota archaeon]|nr:ATP-binding protein [Thermoproteota archaeon]